jgi:DNA-binding beta-propeller fold protein YncE
LIPASGSAALGLVLLGAGCKDSTRPGTETSCSDQPGTICTWAGTGRAGYDGGGRALLESLLYWPQDMAFTRSGAVYIVDWQNHIVREAVNGKLVIRVGLEAFEGDGPLPDSPLDERVPPGVPAAEIALNHPTHILPLPDGRLLVSCWHNHKLRTYDPATGNALVFCGDNFGYEGDGGPAVDALLNNPTQCALDSQENIYVLDQRNQCIRRIAPDGVISTVAGTGVPGFTGDGGDPIQAQFNFPTGGIPPPAGALVCDAQDRLYVSDTKNHRIRRIDFSAGVIETIAGDGEARYAGDGGPAASASLNNPRDLEFGPDGRLYVADELNDRVRAIDLTTGIITTVAGNGERTFAGDGGPALDASLNRPAGLAFDAQGRLFIVDTYNNRIRRVTM